MSNEHRDDLYQSRYVAFLDILGFSNLVDEADKNPVIRYAVADVLATLKNTLVNNPQIDFRITQFSDNIVLSVVPHLYGLYGVFNGARLLCENLIQRGVLLRGGITVGNLIHTEDTLFGPGLITAYRMDDKGSPPRVALDQSIVAEAERYGPDFGFKHDIERDDVDGKPMLHTLREYELYDRAMKPGVVLRDKSAQWVAANIHYEANNLKHSQDVRAKWQWMERYWDRSVSKRGILPLARNAQPPLSKL